MMPGSVLYRVLADVVLLVHASFVVFVIVGLVLVLVGGPRGWEWVRDPWFRLAHALAIGIVVAQAWLGVLCPLTLLENALRSRAGEALYGGSFIAYWVRAALYYDAPVWVFVSAYTLFGLAVVASWVAIRPRAFKRGRDQVR